MNEATGIAIIRSRFVWQFGDVEGIVGLFVVTFGLSVVTLGLSVATFELVEVTFVVAAVVAPL